MFESLLQNLPEGWQEFVTLLLSLVAWIPDWQRWVIDLAFAPSGPWYAVVGSWLLLGLPVLLFVVAIWATMLSAYTLPFRSGRGAYVRVLAFTWWDAGRSVALYWAGVVKFALLASGLLWAALRYAVVVVLRLVRSLVMAPAAALDWTAQRYFKPGMPWLAFVLVIAWSALEAGVFSFTLRPTMYGVLYDLTGAPPNPFVLTAVLYALLFLLIAGSFACIQVLTEAINNRRPKDIVQMLFVEFFVMFFEVMFLYRELIDAITPWIAQQTSESVRLGLWSTLGLACFGWIGIRGMTWFLFGRYGTPALMAILSRQTLATPAGAGARPESQAFDWWSTMIADLKREQAWLVSEAERVHEALLLPVLQLLANGLNFVLVLVGGRPAFELPFSSLAEAMARLPRANRAPLRAAEQAHVLEPATESSHA
ncbi:MAG: hypothetical protein ACRELV_05995 [Longimicrobiales bacterium]